MKKNIYLLLCIMLFTSLSSYAQSFSMDRDTTEVSAYGYVDIFNNITNHTTDTMTISWRIIDHNMPQSWIDDSQFGLCDNVQCYTSSILTGSVQVTDTISAGDKDVFKAQINPSAATVTPTTTGPVFFRAELKNGTTTDTATFLINRWATSVATVNVQDDIKLYPNPAGKNLNITFDKKLDIATVKVYSLVGKVVATRSVDTNTTKISLEDVPSGIYFVRLIDSNGQNVATQRFTHQ